MPEVCLLAPPCGWPGLPSGPVYYWGIPFFTKLLIHIGAELFIISLIFELIVSLF